MRLEARHVETPQEAFDRLRLEVEEVRASRERLARAADADRRGIERELHDGPQQQLVSLAVNLELARRLADSDPAAVENLLEEMGRDVRQALEATGKLAHRIYPPLLEAGGLATALRTAAVAAGVQIRLEIAAAGEWPPEIAGAVYFCCFEVVESVAGSDSAHLTVTVREEEGTLAFEVVDDGAGPAVDALPARDRVEALGGRLEVESEPAHRTRIVGSLPLPR